MAKGNTVVLIDGSDSSRQWIYELVAAMRGLARDIKGKLNVVFFNGKQRSFHFFEIKKRRFLRDSIQFRRSESLAVKLLRDEQCRLR